MTGGNLMVPIIKSNSRTDLAFAPRADGSTDEHEADQQERRG